MTKSSQDRRVKRGVKKGAKKTAAAIAKGNGVDISKEVSLSHEVQGAKIAALEKALERLVKMVTINQSEMLKAFNLTDAHLWVMRQLCKDIVAGTVMLSDSDTPAVNMELYYDLFNAKQRQDAENAMKAKALEEAGVKPPDPNGPEVFGGESNGAHP